MAITVVVPLRIEMTDEQQRQYAATYGLTVVNGKVRARDVVDDVQSYVLTQIQESAAFGEIGDGNGTRGADVTIKRR
jgi:hypothetical protein